MLHLSVPATELINNRTSTFETIGGAELDLEYSLYTISIWESIYKKPYISSAGKLTRVEILGLFKAMCLTPNVDRKVWLGLTGKLEKKIFEYMSDPMSATKINKKAIADPKPGKRHEPVTTESLYSQMAILGIPFECEHWHLNRLLTLIELTALRNSPPKKMSKTEVARAWREQNTAMRQQTKSRG